MKTIKIINKDKAIALILILAVIGTLVFIFSNSLKTKDDSSEQSSEIAGAIKPIVDPDNKVPKDIFEHYVRKCAHFSEFALLGFELILLLYALCQRKLKSIPPSGYVSVVLAFSLCALLDETIQLFSERGSSVTDVWIDIAGGISGCAVSLLLLYLYCIFKMRRKEKKRKRLTST